MELQKTVSELEYKLNNALAAKSAQSSFLAKTSHEMRTLLNAIIGFSNLIIDSGKAHDEIKERLCIIQTTSMELLDMVNDILDVGKIEAGKFELRPAIYCMTNLIHDIASLNTVYSTAKPVRFILTLDDDMPEYLYGDSFHVKQIFNNLLANAFSYTYSGTVEWKVRCEREGDRVWIVSNIQDTGIGIRDESVCKLFNDYTQVDLDSQCRNSGSGLGLSIVKSLVQMMDGTVTVQSEYGKGSLFSVRFRQQLAPQDNFNNKHCAKVNKAGTVHVTYPDFSKASALVVDDTLTSLEVMKGMLAPYLMRVDCVTRGQEAFEMIKGQNYSYDIVFMDHLMPDIDGIKCIQRIRNEIGTKYAENIPIVALSANTVFGFRQLFFENGFQAFLAKPVNPLHLDSVLCRFVSGTGSATKDFEIGCIDIVKGIACFGGSKTIYLGILKSYTANVPLVLASMKKNLALGKLTEYTISVHGLKGLSFSIGAIKAGLCAERLEILGRSGNVETLYAEHHQFENYMENVLSMVTKSLCGMR